MFLPAALDTVTKNFINISLVQQNNNVLHLLYLYFQFLFSVISKFIKFYSILDNVKYLLATTILASQSKHASTFSLNLKTYSPKPPCPVNTYLTISAPSFLCKHCNDRPHAHWFTITMSSYGCTYGTVLVCNIYLYDEGRIGEALSRTYWRFDIVRAWEEVTMK